MNWNAFNTYGDSQQIAFETLCNQLFERYLKRTYSGCLSKFRVINGAGGDGGIEAYGQLASGKIIAVQSKWFRQVLKDGEIGQIRKSITTALDIRPQIIEYIICIPHNVHSQKYGRGKKGEGKKLIENYEERTCDEFTDEINAQYQDLKITWWFEKDIELELQQANNEGVQKYWFEREVISLDYLKNQFNLQKNGWLHQRYIPELHGQGIINKEYKKACFDYDYRQELHYRLEKTFNELMFCIFQIESFIRTNNDQVDINSELEIIKNNLLSIIQEIKNTENAIIEGNDLYKSQVICELKLQDTKLKLKKLKPTNIQKNILPKLISALEALQHYDFPEYIKSTNSCIAQYIKLILGDPGTGKTHGLANCVETHLNQNSPAIIIRAKGSPFQDWTEILSKSLELSNWRKDEILSALETLATKNDIQKAVSLNAGEEADYENTKAIICIDGLEEDIENEKEWYSRLRECKQLAIDYPRIRFMFSARKYFFLKGEIPKESEFESVFLPREGDVPIIEMAKKYFSKEHYNITLSSFSLIKGIDSLLALRLFSVEYTNTNLDDSDTILTATKDLLNLKVDRMNRDFIDSLSNRLGSIRNPILDSLIIMAEYFYSNIEIEHNQLVTLLSPTLNSYLDGSQIDNLIDYLSNNAFIIKSERIDSTIGLNKKEYHYNIAYQSIIEHIISERIFHEIQIGSLNQIPKMLHQDMIQLTEYSSSKDMNYEGKLPNQQIIQNIANSLFLETGKLIGENDFLAEGFSEDQIFEMQMNALIKAPTELAVKYKSTVDSMFFGGFLKQYRIFKHLILPSSYSKDNYFGAEYLHEILINQSSTFERDKLWSGLDDFEIRTFNHEKKLYYEFMNINVAFNEFGGGKLYLSESLLHNELPLVYAWGLSTIDQQLRNDLRIALTAWAINTPSEFLLLLNKIFECNDPQIQEDLASIMLGVAGRLKENKKIKELALWSIKNIFNYLDLHRNILVRQGFRSIVERAFQIGEISLTEGELCRPKQMTSISLLPLEQNLKWSREGECYPIVHDLAWYVIKYSYDGFLEYPSSSAKGLLDNDCKEARSLLNKYRKAYKDNGIFANQWGMEAGIAYIRNLGLTRKVGSWNTGESHGSKSKVFTYEEKYTWLAVHYIQGYLSDYIPMKLWSDEREFVKDYFQLTNIHNPAESIIEAGGNNSTNDNNEWIIKETLSHEIDVSLDIEEAITNYVNEDPIINFENWLNFESSDFNIENSNLKWTALFNHTTLLDSNEYIYSYLDAKACFVKSCDFEALKEIIINTPDDLNFSSNLDSLYSSPKTSTYCNPSDIIWMTWIDEEDTKQTFYNAKANEVKELYHSLTQIVQDNIDGENYIMLPSKKTRELINCYELIGSELKDVNQITKAFNHKITEGSFRNSQELVLIDEITLQEILKKEEYEIIWFIEIIKQKNPLNETLNKSFHIQKARKYFVWIDNNKIKSIKFWDERFTNVRDKDES